MVDNVHCVIALNERPSGKGLALGVSRFEVIGGDDDLLAVVMDLPDGEMDRIKSDQRLFRVTADMARKPVEDWLAARGIRATVDTSGQPPEITRRLADTIERRGRS